MRRVYHRYTNWEDFQMGMYENTCFMDESQMIYDCALTLGCPSWLYESMMFVIIQWEVATEHHMTNAGRNRQAWLGQAACCMTHGAPEYLTKLAWWTLTPEQQVKANAVADEVIEHWDVIYEKGLWTCRKKGLAPMCSQHLA